MGRNARKTPPLGIVLDTAHPDRLHRQIFDQLRAAILERRLPPGAPLPSSRLMATELGCARGTVSAAVDQLVAEGYVVSRAASGIAVAPDLPDDMLAPPLANPPAIAPPPEIAPPEIAPPENAPSETAYLAFPIGQPDRNAFPFPLWAKLLEQEWRRPEWHIAGTPDPFGHPALRRAIAAHLGVARGFACDPAAIVITPGVRQSVDLFARIALQPGDQACIEDPGYPGMAEGLAAASIRPIPVPIDPAGFSLDAALALAPAAKLAAVAPSHHFPLGTVMTLQRRLELLSWAERTKSWIIEDDFDGEYRYAGRPLAPLRALDRTGRVAYLASFSKILFPALRLSFLVLPNALVDAARQRIGIGPGASLLGQGALARFIAEGHLAVHLRRTRLLYAARQAALIHAAQRHLAGLLRIDPDPGGMHLIARPLAMLNDVVAAEAALAHGVRVYPLSPLYQATPPSPGLILGYAATPEPAIAPALQRLATALL